MVAFSDEIKLAEAVPVKAFGQDLVLYRGEDAGLVALDAHCPHMGAHLGHGGKVVADDIICPFHGWRWNHEGACVHIPYSGTCPSVKIRKWHCRDQNGFVYLWYDPAHHSPAWEMMEIPEVSDPGYRITARKVWRDICTHPQELSENGVDVAHFSTVHGFVTRGIDWQPEGHRYVLNYDIDPLRSGAGEYWLQSMAEGPYGQHTRFSGSVEGVTIHGCVVTETGRLDIYSLYIFKDTVSDEAAQQVFENSQAGWAADLRIWHNKRYRHRPLTLPEESLVHEFRNWYQQFYPTGDVA